MDAGHVLGVVHLRHVERGGLQHSHCKYVLLHLLADVLCLAESGFGFKSCASFNKFVYNVTARYVVAFAQSTDTLLVQPGDSKKECERVYTCELRAEKRCAVEATRYCSTSAATLADPAVNACCNLEPKTIKRCTCIDDVTQVFVLGMRSVVYQSE